MKKIISHYLPQYHSFPENDKWWGEGFTEWTCVRRGFSTASDHRIKKPHVDIGYYTLLDKEVRARQALMAKQYGVYGFCYYHYWFGDVVLMDKTLQLMLHDGEPDLPFCFSWANEPWTRRMNGGNGELLQPNNYGGEEEWRRHLDYLLPFFKHKNYILIDNKPMFLIYRVSQIKDYQQRFDYWNRQLKKCGFNGIYLVMTIGNFSDDYVGLGKYVNACFDFYPNFMWQDEMIFRKTETVAYFDMPRVYQRIMSDPPRHEVHFKGTLVGFDSSPRSPRRSNVFINGSPQLFGFHLDELLSGYQHEYLFVNAWNEWGEGCALEPEEVDGYSYLESLRRSVGKFNVRLC